jgi:hypothetical protein
VEVAIWERIIKPEDCAFAFGIPTTRSSFLSDLSNPNKEFARRYDGGWQQYYAEVVSNVEEVCPALNQFGVRVLRDISMEGFWELFAQKDVSVVILFSHWTNRNGGAVEFAEGLVSTPAIVDAVPMSFAGVVDLCVCHPEALTTALRALRPNSLVRYVEVDVIPYYWLPFYAALFNHIENNNVTYLRALEEVIESFFRGAVEGIRICGAD